MPCQSDENPENKGAEKENDTVSGGVISAIPGHMQWSYYSILGYKGRPFLNENTTHMIEKSTE